MNDTKPTPEQIKELQKRIQTGQITRDMLQRLLSTPEVVPEKQPSTARIKKPSSWTTLMGTMQGVLKIDSSGVSPHFTEEHFPLGGASLVEYDVDTLELGRDFITTNQVLMELQRLGFGRPEVDDLMKFGAKKAPSYAAAQFVALIPLPWSPSPSSKCVPCLVKTATHARVTVLDISNAWSRDTHFLVRKPRRSA